MCIYLYIGETRMSCDAFASVSKTRFEGATAQRGRRSSKMLNEQWGACCDKGLLDATASTSSDGQKYF